MATPANNETLDKQAPAPAAGALAPGEVIAARYRIEKRLGQGGMGTVYRAEHTRVGRKVALKVLGADWLGHADISRRFREEARAASAAGHPNIIEVFDAGELPDGRPFLVMEYLEGEDLYTLIHTERPSVEETCRIVADVARGLAAAHARGVIHRDLKSENVMVVERAGMKLVKVLDFGIAALRNDADRPSTMLGRVMGTPAYMAPEQAKGARVTPAADIYALGVLLHEMLTGSVPFDPLGPQAMLIAKINAPAPSIATVRDDLPDVLVELVDQCLASDPDQRPASANEVAARLDRMLDAPANTPTVVEADETSAEFEVSPLPDGPPATPADPAPRHGRWLLPAAAALLVLGAAAAYGLSRSPSVATVPPAVPDQHSIAHAEPDSRARATAVPPAAPSGEAEAEPADAPATPAESEPTQPTPEPEPGSSAPAPTSTPAEPDTDAPDQAPAKAIVGTPAASKPAADEPTGTPDPNLCWRTRKQASQARQNHDWPGVLSHTRSRTCWRGRENERLQLRTKAHMELEHWAACIEAGERLGDPQAHQWVKLCRRRQGQG